MSELQIAEHFYSVQCEGISTGSPAYFVRLKGCNLSCGFSGKALSALKKDIKNGKSTDIDTLKASADLMTDNKATWFCDSAAVWLFGKGMTFGELVNHWHEQGIYYDIFQGNIHIIWTGGEPTLPKHQEAIVDFYRYICDMEGVDKWGYHEIETNGTLALSDEMLHTVLDQINCSVKLENSGMSVKRRINPEALELIMSHKNYSFKFVVSEEKDFEEIFNTFTIPFNIPQHKICVMPGLDSQEDFHERTLFVLEMAKKYRIRGLTRLHISAWDKATGV